VRESEMYNGEAYANAGMARAEDLRLRYPRPVSTRSRQFAAYMDEAILDWNDIPEYASIPFWFGCVFRWLDHPMECEDEMFALAKEELRRLRGARA
jgi:hypothetical protein